MHTLGEAGQQRDSTFRVALHFSAPLDAEHPDEAIQGILTDITTSKRLQNLVTGVCARVTPNRETLIVVAGRKGSQEIDPVIAAVILDTLTARLGSLLPVIKATS